jgi:iron(III) transport system substrate-binding protein
MVTKISLLVCGGAFLISGAVQASEWKDQAKAEKRLVWYTTIGSADAKMLVDEFRRRYPKIAAEYFRTGGPQLVERIFTEARAGKQLWDVFMNSAIYTHLLNEKGMLAVYESPESRFYRDGYKDPRGTWTSIYTNYAVAGYNTKLVTKDEAPKSYSDLLKPVWAGQIGMDAKSYEWFAVVVRGLGEEKGLSLMRQLAKNKVQLRNGRELVAQLVAAGEFKLALTAYSQNYEALRLGGAQWTGLRSTRSMPIFIRSRFPPKRLILTRENFLSISCCQRRARKSCEPKSGFRTESILHRNFRASSKG